MRWLVSATVLWELLNQSFGRSARSALQGSKLTQGQNLFIIDVLIFRETLTATDLQFYKIGCVGLKTG